MSAMAGTQGDKTEKGAGSGAGGNIGIHDGDSGGSTQTAG